MKTQTSKKELTKLRGLSGDELQGKLKEAKEELFKLRFQLAIRQLENTSKIGEVRNRIAMIQSVLGQSKAAGGAS